MKNQLIGLLRTVCVVGLMVALPLAAMLDRGGKDISPASEATLAEPPAADLASPWTAPPRLRAAAPSLPKPEQVPATTVALDDPFRAWQR